jgi:hypothetical protein
VNGRAQHRKNPDQVIPCLDQKLMIDAAMHLYLHLNLAKIAVAAMQMMYQHCSLGIRQRKNRLNIFFSHDESKLR